MVYEKEERIIELSDHVSNGHWVIAGIGCNGSG